MNTITLGDPRDFLVYRQGSGKTIEIFDIVVGTERGVGKGRSLVDLLVKEVCETTSLIFAITRVTNRISQIFYQKVGFRRMGTLKSFYSDTAEDAIVYGLDVVQII